MKNYLYFFLISSLYFQNLMSSVPLSERSQATFEKSEKSLMQHKTKDAQELENLLGLRNQKNIIILNDLQESYKNFWFADKNEPEFQAPGVLMELLRAMLENQAILCTKSLLVYFRFLSNLWLNFLELTPEQLHNHYFFLENVSFEKIKSIKKTIKQLEKFSKRLHRTEDLSEQDDITNEMIKTVKESVVHHELLFYLFIVQEYHQEMVKKTIFNKYEFYEVNPLYILLYPRSLSPIDVSLLRKMDINAFTAFISEYDDENDIHLDRFCMDAIKKVVKKENDETLKARTPDHNFFNWNIFMIGHGDPDKIILSLNHITFIQILKYFNQNHLANSLSVLSCFASGKTLKEFFGHEFFSEVDPLIPKISFPVLFFGLFFSKTYSLPLKGWKNFRQNFLDIYFSSFFRNVESRNFFSALDVFGSYHNQQGIYNNYGAVKFPNVNWITVNDYQKNVFNITKVSIAAAYPKYTMEIPDSKNIVLLNTNVIPLHIMINMAQRNESNQCKFLPVFYADPNYAINLIDLAGIAINPVNREEQIAQILYNLFDVKAIYLMEPISIFIKTVFVGRNQIKNVLIELDKNQIFFESLNKPGMIVKGAYINKKWLVEKIEPGQDYMQKINEMEKKLSDVATEGFLSDLNPEFVKNLKNLYKPKLNPTAKPFIPQFQRLNPQGQPFAPKIQPIQRWS